MNILYIYNQPTKEIKDELVAENSWIQEGIESIFKVPRTKILKICMNQTAAAKKATEAGLLAFYMRIPPTNISIEEYIPIFTCMRCYKIEDHPTYRCQHPREYKACSECASIEHTWRECTATEKKCLNCHGAHRTLANKCPLRKDVKDKKINDIKKIKKKHHL